MRTAKKGRSSIKSIQRNLIRAQLILIITLALLLGSAGTIINIRFETQKRDENLQNIAETIARSPMLDSSENDTALTEYLDSLKETLSDIDVISIVDRENHRRYHSNAALIGTVYDGTMPDFENDHQNYCAANDSGPSGIQRRAYAAVYDENGDYAGFVLAVMLMENIHSETMQTLLVFALITLAAVFIEILISASLSARIRESLNGFEPDVFSAMYQIRDNILETLEEGIVAVDKQGEMQFSNKAASLMLGKNAAAGQFLQYTLESGEREFGIKEPGLRDADILIDRIPIREDGEIIGAVGILHDRAEYVKLMEDLAGTRFLVDSMRANNHDFTNKLHVILGLIQMEMYDKAVSYIENISIVQRQTISAVMHAVDEPAMAALLIGKMARASELNIHFTLREGSLYSRTDLTIPVEVMVTVIGNLIENAFEAMNTPGYDGAKELLLGIFSKPGEVLITVSDTGYGIAENNMNRIFENGYSTKGKGRGTGLYQVKNMVEGNGGSIISESQIGVGTTFTVHFAKEKKHVQGSDRRG